MDPVSVVGGVIAIATFIKDIIELAQQIQKSVDKVPQSRKNLRKLTTDITQSFIELGKVYEDRKHVLDESSEMHAALSDLSRHMHAVYGRCVSLTVPGASGRINKLRAAFKAWSNCNIIEAEIMGLKDEVQAFSMRFMMFAIARIEKPISGIASATSRIEQTLVVLDQHQRQGLSRMEGFVASLRVSNTIDVNYPQPVTANSTSPLDTLKITSEAVEELYLHRQVETIASSLGNVTTARSFVSEQPRGPYLEPFKPDVPRQWGTDQTPAARHREVVAATWEIVDILQGPSGELSVQRGAWRMVNLAIRLHGLEMYPDAAAIGSWTVDLYRTLMSTNAEVYEPYLSLALRNLSRYMTDVGDHEGAAKAIEECIARERGMLDKPARHSVHLELSNSLLEWWCIVTRDGNLEKGLEIAEESPAHLQSIRTQLREWEHWTSDMTDDAPSLKTIAADGKSDGNAASRRTCVQGWDDTSTLWLDYNTARTYQILSYSLESVGRIPDAWEKALQALAIYRDICNRHPGNFDANLAGCLAYLSHLPHFDNLPPSASITRMRESVQLYRKLSASRPVKFTSRLIESLWGYATLLHDSGEFDASCYYSAEALELTRHSTSDPLLLANALQQSSWSLRHLKQNETVVAVRREIVEIYRDLSTDPTTIADQLYDLSSDHLVAGQKDDAVATCKEAVEYYRSISPPNDGSLAHLADLAKGLSYLTHTLNGAQKYSQALMAGSEALGLYRRLIIEDRNLVEPYLKTLRRTSFSALHGNDSQVITIHMEILHDLRGLAIDYPDRAKWLLVDAFFDHNYILTKHLRTHEAYLNSEELVECLRAMPIEDSEVPSKLMAALITHAGSYAELGRSGEALILCGDAVAVGQKFAAETDNSEIALGLADALSTYSQCLRGRGRYDEALSASEAALKIYRLHPVDDTTVLACRLREYSINLQYGNHLWEAIAIAEEAVELCRSSSSSTAPFARTRLLYVLETLSAVVAEAGDEGYAFSLIQEATDLYHQIKTNPTITEPWAFIEVLYANTLFGLSSRFAARSNWEDATVALSEATTIYKRRVAFSPAYHTPLATALDLTSVHLCAAGRHEEAILAANDLLDRQRRLDALDPELAMLVRVALAELRGRRTQSSLRERHRQCVRCSSVGT